MANRGAAAPPVESVYDSLVEHEVRRWSAAEENARRHAQRATLLLTSVVAFVAVGLFRFGLGTLGSPLHLANIGGIEVEPCIRVLVVFGIGFALIGSAYVVGVLGSKLGEDEPRKAQDERRKPASTFLDLAKDPFPLGLEVPDRGTTEYYRFRIYARTREAANYLEGRNASERARLDRAQFLFGFGIGLICLAIGAYAIIPRRDPPPVSPPNAAPQAGLVGTQYSVGGG